ncbi:hypothetical protein [Devosia sp.]|uniref:hypothetical protein n=1 Tax=Devosia sp. TaxID=1871048 RepID=UPI001AD4FE1F|nr:hypothetical protein [Devosia sp.]MBN9335621.1 hypothetical protein [Devosia sp.]
MAVAFPFSGFDRIGLRIRSGIAHKRDRGGLLLTQRTVEPYWAGPFTTGKLTPAAWSNLVAFLSDCVDRNLRVDFVHPRHEVPRAYTLATWPLFADPVLVSVTHGREIVVSGLQVGMELKRGDRFTLMQGEQRCYRSLAADLVVASAISQAIPLTPRMPLGIFAAGALVRFKMPPVRLAVVADSFQDDEVYAPSSLTFEAEEALK